MSKNLQITAAILTAAITLSACGSPASSVSKTSESTASQNSTLSSFSSMSNASTEESSVSAGSDASTAEPPVSAQSNASSEDTSSAYSAEPDPISEPLSADASEDSEHFPSFFAKDLEGNTVTDAIFANAKLTMVNVWGTFCGPCIQEMPSLGELSKELADEGFQILGAVCDVADFDGNYYSGQLEEAQKIVETTGASYTHIIPLSDFAAILSEAYYIPMTYFVDSDGRILGEPLVGSRSKEEWKALIEEKLSAL